MKLNEIAFAVNARAAGLWIVRSAELVQVEFWATEDMPQAVAKAFREVTLRVGLSRVELGIVAAAVEQATVESVADHLPADVGSGYWLRQFQADRSIAVPLIEDGAAVAVLSVAVPGPNSARIQQQAHDFLESWFRERDGLDSQ